MKSRLSKIVLLAIGISSAPSAVAQQTETLYLSGRGKDDPVQWEFYCTAGRSSGQWATIAVPSNWELQGFGSYNYGSERKKSTEQGKYRYRFTAPADWAGKVVSIVFEGVMTDAEVAVNGKAAGPVHQGGFYRFSYDITDKVCFGQENLLEVTASKVSSNHSVEQAERQADYWVFGGIYRPVYLEAKPAQHIERIAVDARADGTILADVYLKGVTAGGSVEAVITEPRVGDALLKADVAPRQEKVTLKGVIPGMKPWTAETPNLYSLAVSLRSGDRLLHTVQQRIGFRTFEVRPGDGLYLNGQKIRLKGISRHSFWPDSGRCLSRQINYDDARLIKSMNMNAVRMSHYPPDTDFLDACDEIGLYVLDELAGWQKPPYDTEVGRKLVKEMVTRDVCHPCILFWDNGNEGGWNTELDGDFALYDPQKRIVLHPWANFSNVDTDHYEVYASTQKKLQGPALFMSTEFLHGLYDGGHGAGLDDYWRATYESPYGAGGFLWALLDEGVVRTDKEGQIDVAGNQAPDGIVGPYRQKEGSYYTVKEIWSPIQISLETLPPDFGGNLEVENRYDFTNLKQCTFQIRLVRFPSPWDERQTDVTLSQADVTAPEVAPHARGTLRLSLPDKWREADVLLLTAFDPARQEIWTWSWGLHSQQEYASRSVPLLSGRSDSVLMGETQTTIRMTADDLRVEFSKETGQLSSVNRAGRAISFTGGPRLLAGQSTLKAIRAQPGGGPDAVLKADYEGNLRNVTWTVYRTGWVRLDYEYSLEGEFDLMGVTFDYPEKMVRAIRWMGRGPYRVWKNRMKGTQFDVWHNKYNESVPAVTYKYPEFKGYFRDWNWMVLETAEGPMTVVNATDGLFFGMYRPPNGPVPANTRLTLPDHGIALLHGIPAIGNKFDKPETLGPQSRKNKASGTYRGTVYFWFGPRAREGQPQ